MKFNKTKLIIAFAVISIVSSFLIFIDGSRPNAYSLLWLLPLVFALCILLVLLLKKTRAVLENLAALSLVVLFFLRNVVTPIIMRFGNYASYFAISDSTEAILLMCYEMFICFVVIMFSVKTTRTIGIENNFDSSPLRQTSFLFKMVFWSIIVFMFAAVVTVPGITKMYASVFNYGGALQTETVETLSAIYSNRPLITLFTLFADFMRVLIPTYLFLIVKKIFRSSNFSLFICLLIISFQFFFVGETSALAIFSAVVNFLVLYKLYYSKRRLILLLTGIGGVIGIILISVFKFENNVLYSGSTMEILSKTFQAYLTGVSNVSSAFKMPSEGKGTYLFFDFYYSIPFNNSLFGLSGFTSASIFNSSNSGKFQIIPCVSQSCYYLGPLFAPVISALFACFGVRVFEKSKGEKNIWIYTARTLLWIYLIVSIVMYNGQIFMVRLTNTILPCVIVACFSKIFLNRETYYGTNRKSGVKEPSA